MTKVTCFASALFSQQSSLGDSISMLSKLTVRWLRIAALAVVIATALIKCAPVGRVIEAMFEHHLDMDLSLIHI